MSGIAGGIKRGAPAGKSLNAARVFGGALMLLWAAAALAILSVLLGEFDDYRAFLPPLLRGLGITLLLVAVSFVIGAALSFPLALARMSPSAALCAPAAAYIYFFRGTPLIAQTFLVYYGFGAFREFWQGAYLWWFFREPLNCAIFVFSLNSAAYQAEILRGAIGAVARGQTEAAAALGLRRVPVFFRVVLPQALVVALRPYGNEIILLLKASAIASIITVFDLMGETRRLFSRTFDYNTYLLAALIYLSLVEVLRVVWQRLEGRLTRHLRR